jgi:hypothetical protein
MKSRLTSIMGGMVVSIYIFWRKIKLIFFIKKNFLKVEIKNAKPASV